MKDFLEIVKCPALIPYIIGFGQAIILNRVFANLEAMNAEAIHGFSAILLQTEHGNYVLSTMYEVGYQGYRIYEAPSGDKNWYRITNKVVAIRENKLSDFFNKNKLKPYKDSFVRKRGAYCWGRRFYTCISSTGLTLELTTTYSMLVLKCNDDSIRVESLELFDDIINAMRDPLHKLVDTLSRKSKYKRELVEETLYSIDKGIIAYVGDLIVREKLVLPREIREVDDLVNYLKSHYRWLTNW
ncbi:MAG: hypothetical protein ABWW65_05055 [Thermoprotei archaeon]